jgi:hypothetical protein
MQTIRLGDPWRGGAPRQLEFGSSEWAADSCLVEWSTFERQWLPPTPSGRRAGAPAWLRSAVNAALGALGALLVLGAGGGALWAVLVVLPGWLPG